MGRIQKTRPRTRPQKFDSPHYVRWPQSLRSGRNGATGIHLQEHWAVKTIDVAAGLVFRDGKLLITQRYAEAHLGGLWEFPGGKREPNETFEQCLTRELSEELGIEVVVGQLVESLTHEYPGKSVHLRFF